MADQTSKPRKSDEINRKFVDAPDSMLTAVVQTGLYPN